MQPFDFIQKLKPYLNKKILLGIVIVILLVLSFRLFSNNKPPAPTIPLVKTEAINSSNNHKSRSYSGEVKGRYESRLSFQASGKIIKRHVEPGSVVQTGDIIMELDPKDIQQSVNASSAIINSSKAQLSLAEKNLQRYQKLYEQQAISRIQLDNVQLQYEAALASFQQANAQYTQSGNMLNYTKIIADQTGVITSVQAEVSQVVQAGQPIVTLVQDKELEVEISVPENSILELQKSKSINVKLWALKENIIKGIIREVSPMADPITKTYNVRISLQNPPPNIRLGMTATVSVDQQANNAIILPLASIYQTSDQPHVWLIVDGKTKLQPITPGKIVGDKVEILSGVNNNDVVVTAGIHKLYNGQAVRLSAGD